MYAALQNGTKMPMLGLGTSGVDAARFEKTIDTALEIGYRHIDTAYVYNNEHLIGQALAKWFKSGRISRQELFITTKLPTMGMTPEKVRHFAELSLKKLQLAYIDLYLIHFPVGSKYEGDDVILPRLNANGYIDVDFQSDFIAVWKKMEELVDLGLVKNIGLSNFSLSQIQRILDVARIKPANLQIELNLFLQQRTLVDFCKRNGISIVAYHPLGGANYNTRMARIYEHYEPLPLPEILNNTEVVKSAEKYKKTPGQIALKFLIQNGIAPIPKSSTPHRMQENLNVFDFDISQQDMEILTKLEVGESARITKMLFFKGFEDHPEYPF